MTAKDTSWVKEQFPSENARHILFIAYCKSVTEEQSKEVDRIIAITELRVLLILPRLMWGKTVEHSFLLSSLMRLSVDSESRLRFHYKTGDGSSKKGPSDSWFAAKCSGTSHKTMTDAILEAIEMSNASIAQPLTVELAADIPLHSPVYTLSQSEKFSLAFRVYAAVDKHPVDDVFLDIVMANIDDAQQRVTEDASISETFEMEKLMQRAAVAKGRKRLVVDERTVLIILRSLTHVTAFEQLRLDKIPLSAAQLSALARLLAANGSLNSLDLRSTGLDQANMASFSAVLSGLGKVHLDTLVLSYNDMEDGGVFAAISPKCLTAHKLYVANCNLNERSMEMLVNLLLTPEWSSKKLGTFTLDISGNPFTKNAAMISQQLGRYLKTTTTMSALTMRNCKVSLNVMTELMLNRRIVEGKLRVLECGGNQMTPYGANAIAQIIAGAPHLGYVSIRNIRLQEVLVKVILEGACAPPLDDEKSQESAQKRKIHLNFDFSRTEDSVRIDATEIVRGIDSVDASLWKHSVIRGFLLSNLRLDTCFDGFCHAIGKVSSLKRLVIDFNFTFKKKGSHRDDVMLLVNALQKMSSLQELIVNGNCDGRSKKYLTRHDLVPLFEHLKEDTTLRQLVLDGNKLEDAGAVLLAQKLAHNFSLEIVSVENCKIGYKGVIALLKCISERSKLQSVLPTRGMAELQKSCSKKNWAKITELLQAKLPILYRNLEAFQRERAEADDDDDDEDDGDDHSEESAAADEGATDECATDERATDECAAASKSSEPFVAGRKRGTAMSPKTRKPPPKARGSAIAKAPPRRKPVVKVWPPPREADEKEEKKETVSELPRRKVGKLKMPAFERKETATKPRHSVLAGLSRGAGAGSNVKNLAGLLAGKPLLGVKSYSGSKRPSALLKSGGPPSMSLAPDSAAERGRTFSMQFSSNLQFEDKDSVEAKMDIPAAASRKRKKRTRKKLVV